MVEVTKLQKRKSKLRNGYFMDIDLMSRIKIIIHIFAPPYIIYRTYSNACSTTEKYITPILLQQRNNTSQLYKQQLYTPIFHNKWWPCSKSLQKPWRNSFDSVSPTHVVENATKTLKKFDIDSVTLDVTLWYRFCYPRYQVVEDIEQSGETPDYRAECYTTLQQYNNMICYANIKLICFVTQNKTTLQQYNKYDLLRKH